MKPQAIYIMANTAARTLNLKELETAAAHMNRFIPTRIFPTSSAEHAASSTIELGSNPANLVVACGGDGTVYTILNALPEKAAMGIIPAGTANVIARELGIPLNLRNAGKAILTGAVNEIDTGCCNGQKFAFVAGIGFDAQVAGAVSPLLKRVFGRAAYHMAGLGEFLTYRPPLLSVRVNNAESYKCRFAIVANMRRYGGELFFAPKARYDDQRLDLLMLHRFSVGALLRLLNFARGNGTFPADVASAIQCTSCIIDTDRPCPYQLDGEVFAATDHYEFSVNLTPTRIITP